MTRKAKQNQTDPSTDGKKTRGRSRNSADKARIAVRETKALELRQKGMSYREIAAELECSPDTAMRDITRALAKCADLSKKEAEHYREIETQRLDKLLSAVWSDATKKNGNVKLGAVQTAIRILESRRKLLGLDSPEKHTADLSPEAQELLEYLRHMKEQRQKAIDAEFTTSTD